MSDDDDFMHDSEEEYDFDYESDEGSDGDPDLENQYFNSKQQRDDDAEAALAGFAKVIELEQPPGEWGFKAHKQTMKLLFRRGGDEDYNKMLTTYASLLTYVKSAVPRNYSEKSLNNMMELIATSQNVKLFEQFFEMTMKTLQEDRKDLSSDRLWFKAHIKLGKMYLDSEDYVKLAKILKQLENSCLHSDGTDDEKKGTQLFEIFSLKFPMLTAQKNTKELKQEYNRALKINSAIPHPNIMGIIRECGGKMHLAEEQWKDAYQDFFEAFKNYDEAGSSRRINCLKMLVLANMLMKSTVDPFDAQESKPYKDNPEIQAMTSLVIAYQNHDIKQFERILKTNKKKLMDDPFIREYISDLLKNIQTEVLIKLIKPYSRIRIQFISTKLNIPSEEVESLLRMCILDGSIRGEIDQIGQLLVVDTTKEGEVDIRADAINTWAKELQTLLTAVSAKLG